MIIFPIIRYAIIPFFITLVMVFAVYQAWKGISSAKKYWFGIGILYLFVTMLYTLPIIFYNPYSDPNEIEINEILELVISSLLMSSISQGFMVIGIIILLIVQAFFNVNYSHYTYTNKLVLHIAHFFSGYYFQGIFGGSKEFYLFPTYSKLHDLAGFLFLLCTIIFIVSVYMTKRMLKHQQDPEGKSGDEGNLGTV